MKKGRHRRYEEARALKRSFQDDDIEGLMGRLDEDPFALPETEEADAVHRSGWDESDFEDDDDA